MTKHERSLDRNAGLEKETQAENMRWNVYKRTKEGFSLLKSKEGNAFGAWGHFKAEKVLEAIAQKPWNKGFTFVLLNNCQQTYREFLFGR